jgi:hypothetical protein
MIILLKLQLGLHVFITQVEENAVRVVGNTFVWSAGAHWIL